MNKTGIEYLNPGFTWNPLAMRCTPDLSPGCDHCWHLAFAKRHAGNDHFSDEVRAAYRGGKPVLREKELEAPLRRKKPAVIGCQFMGDLFHEKVDTTDIGKVFHVMSSCHERHKFLVLTKRPERAVKYFELFHMPSNLTLGASASNQPDLDRVVGPLLECPAACRVLSLEPLLDGPDLGACKALPIYREADAVQDRLMSFGEGGKPACVDRRDRPGRGWCKHSGNMQPWIDGVIVGGESGSDARPMHPDWVRGVRDQCAAAGVPFYLKQWSSADSDRVAKLLGRKLDGVEHNELPEGLKL